MLQACSDTTRITPCKTDWQQKWLRLDVVDKRLQKLADDAENFCGRFYRNDTQKSLLVIIGPYGCGKTHVAKSIWHFCRLAATGSYQTGVWPDGNVPSTLCVSWPMACNALNERKFSLVQDYIQSDLLVLDDIGAENDPWKVCADKLCQVLSRRERKFTVITTNVKPVEWPNKFDGRIADRLLRNSIVVDLTGLKSYALI